MKIHVISLVTSKERREKIYRELTRLGLDFTYFDAISGELSDINEYDNTRRMWEKGHALTRGEQGCFASHKALWNECASAHEPFLIMEDDVVLSDSFPELISNLKVLVNKFGYIRLGRGTCNALLGIGSWLNIDDIDDGKSIVKYMKGTSGSYAYMLSPSAALKFISASKYWSWPVDDFMSKEYLHRVDNYGIEPSLAWPIESDSDIGDRIKPATRSLISRIRKEYYRAKDKLANNIYNYIFCIRNS